MRAKIAIYEHDADEAHDLIAEVEADVKGGKVETEWEYEYHEDTDEIPTDAELGKAGKKYAHPEYFFVVRVASKEAKSGILKFQDWMELRPKDAQGDPVPNRDYVVTFADGSERKGKLDGEGYARIEDVPPGPLRIRFPKK